ncbi:hypothetical protein TNCV_2411561 [Trichonephila clavipes]|nr:hypothetical protein TNCV_2411561 [Trichonephila clavipes]
MTKSIVNSPPIVLQCEPSNAVISKVGCSKKYLESNQDHLQVLDHVSCSNFYNPCAIVNLDQSTVDYRPTLKQHKLQKCLLVKWFGVSEYCHTRELFGDAPRNFKQRSSDVDDTRAGIPLSKLLQREDV